MLKSQAVYLNQTIAKQKTKLNELKLLVVKYEPNVVVFTKLNELKLLVVK